MGAGREASEDRPRIRLRSYAGCAVAVASLLLLASGAQSAEAAVLNGKVKSGSEPVKGAPVTLIKTTVARVGPVAIGQDRTDRRGRFSISYRTPGRANSVLYVISGVPDTRRRREVRLASLLGAAPYPARATLNERTTIAAGFAEAQFISGWRIHGKAPGPQNGAMMATNLANPRSGRIGETLTTAPNAGQTITRRAFNSLANALASCARNEKRCSRFFEVTRVPGKRRTESAIKAIAGIARNPANSVGRIFRLSRSGPTPYGPAIEKKADRPNNWQLFIRFWGDGVTLDGPGNIAFDEEGNAWVANNYEWSPDRGDRPPIPVCGADNVIKFLPDGSYAPDSPYVGGGLSGVGYGIGISPETGNVWLSNFGFAASPPGCPEARQPAHNSLTEVQQDGTFVSPDGTGYTEGMMSWPQGLAFNRDNDLWVTNCGPFNDPESETGAHDSLTIYPDADRNQAISVRDPDVDHPFDVAFNTNGKAFVSNMGNDSVTMYKSDGTPTARSPITGGGLKSPMGVASDSRGNIWVSNSQTVRLPCPSDGLFEPAEGSVTLINSKGEVQSPPEGFTGGGAQISWGMAIDGNDNVWISNFGGQRISSFCGVREKGCPKGAKTGDPISPDGGYAFGGFSRLTATEIDPTGNVWMTNNWKLIPWQTNPGGYEVVVAPGAAAPVRTPLVQTPEPLR